MASNTEAGWTQTRQTTSAWTTPDSNQSLAADVYKDCVVIGLNRTIPWDNPHNLISHEVEKLIERVKSAILIPILFLIGAPGNLLNMAVFFKQGIKDRINMCLFALAVADLLNITIRVVLYAERVYNQFTDEERYPLSFRYIMNNNVLGLVGVTYAPPLISVVIAIERCVCVLFPLRAQRCMPTRMLTMIILVSTSAVVVLRFVVTSKYQVDCFHEMMTGRTSWRVIVLYKNEDHKAALTLLDGVLYGFLISIGCPVVVFFTTTITAIRLRQIIKWRRHASSSISSSSSMSSKEVGLTKMLICLSAEFFVLSIPIFVIRIGPMFLEDLKAGGKYANTHETLISLNELCLFASSSVNFFVYYCTGTRFRQTLHAMMTRRSPAGIKTSASKAVCSQNKQDCSSAADDHIPYDFQRGTDVAQ